MAPPPEASDWQRAQQVLSMALENIAIISCVASGVRGCTYQHIVATACSLDRAHSAALGFVRLILSSKLPLRMRFTKPRVAPNALSDARGSATMRACVQPLGRWARHARRRRARAPRLTLARRAVRRLSAAPGAVLSGASCAERPELLASGRRRAARRPQHARPCRRCLTRRGTGSASPGAVARKRA
jgi:hypothetical protein